MDPKAVEKARTKIRAAERAVQALIDSKTFDEFEDEWSNFLTSAKRVYTALEQGAKVSPQSRQWFGAKNRERHDDELLQYLYQARDDDEHGLQQVTKRKVGHIAVGVQSPGYAEGITIDYMGPNRDGGGLVVEGLRDSTGNDLPIKVTYEPPTIELAEVRSRDRSVVYKPPTTHKGSPLASNDPIAVAQLCLVHLRSVVAEAAALS